MRAEVPPSRFGYGVIAAGTVLSIVSAGVPFYTAGYQLLFAVFMAGITTYQVYGLVVYWLRRPITIVAGALLLAAHLGLVVHECFIKGSDYSDPAIYVVPLVFTAVLVPLLVVAMRQPWRE
jgi:disulfide bond formation protein DsbB